MSLEDGDVLRMGSGKGLGALCLSVVFSSFLAERTDEASVQQSHFMTLVFRNGKRAICKMGI